jgi:hypothetical protein
MIDGYPELSRDRSNGHSLLTELDAKTLGRSLHKWTGDASFFVAGIDLEQSEGFLPKVAWDWIKRRRTERFGAAAGSHST